MNLEEIQPRERSGSATQARFSYQNEFSLTQCINMLENPDLEKVYCDFHGDCVVKDNRGFHTFFQVKGWNGRLLSLSLFQSEALDDMFYNFSLADGDCRSVLATNAQIHHDLRKIIEAKNNYHKQIATAQEKLLLENAKKEWRTLVEDKKDLMGKFVEEFEILYNLPTFYEEEIQENRMSLKDFNINRLKVVLDKILSNNFSIEDTKIIHSLIFDEVEVKAQLQTRSNRYLTKDDLLDKIGIPSFQRMYFTHKFTPEEIDHIKNQSILEGKLEQGGFSPYFINQAKLVRYVTLYSREKLSKIRAVGTLIDEFEYRLIDTCIDVFEEHAQKSSFNSHEMLKDLQKKLMFLASDPSYQSLNIRPDFIKGLIWEATSQCRFRWDNDFKQ